MESPTSMSIKSGFLPGILDLLILSRPSRWAACTATASCSESGRSPETPSACGNGIDDGRETQANLYRGLLNALDRHPGVVNGVFWWDNWVASDELWAGHWSGRRAMAIRDRPSEEVVRSAYALRRGRANRPPEPAGALAPLTIGVDDAAVTVEVAAAFRDPDGDPLTYRASSSPLAVVATAASGSTVTVTPVAAGTAAATDPPLGLSAIQRRSGVTVTAAATGSFTDDPLVPGGRRSGRCTSRSCGRASTPCGRRQGCRGSPGRIRSSERAYAAAGRPGPPYADASPQARRTPVRPTHLMELRAAGGGAGMTQTDRGSPTPVGSSHRGRPPSRKPDRPPAVSSGQHSGDSREPADGGGRIDRVACRGTAFGARRGVCGGTAVGVAPARPRRRGRGRLRAGWRT